MFQISLEIELNDHHYSVSLIESSPPHFCFESRNCFVFGNGIQRHANKGTQQTAEHRLP